MSDFDRFEGYWQETSEAIYYRVCSAQDVLLTRKSIEELWREEIDKRFFSSGVLHGATSFLNELKERRPDAGAKVQTLLRTVPPLGCEREEVVKSGVALAGGAAGILASAVAGGPKLLRVFSAGASAAVTAYGIKTAAEMAGNTPARLSEEVNRASAEWLEEFRVLLTESAE